MGSRCRKVHLRATLVGQRGDHRAGGQAARAEPLSEAGEQRAVRAGLGGPGSGFTSAAKPPGKERETERTGSPALAVPVPYAKAPGLLEPGTLPG